MRPDPVIARTAGRPAIRSGALWGLVLGFYVVASASGYATTYPTVAARLKFARSVGGSGAFAALIGPARHLETVAGFTAWRTMGVLTVVCGVWGLMLATRLLRAEEDAGRWELLLTRPTTRTRTSAEVVLALAVGLAAMWTTTASLTVSDGLSAKVHFSVGGSLELATSLVCGALMFVGVGALTSQLAGTRRRANSFGALFLGAAYLVRMIADSGSGLEWVRWASPLGWTEELHPLGHFHPLALVPIVGFAAACAGLAVAVAGRRDLGASLIPNNDTPPARLGLLTGATGLAARLTQGVAVGWLAGVAVLGLVLGVVAQSASGAITGSASIQKAIIRLGGRRLGEATFLGVVLLMAAALVAFLAAGQVAATRSDEAEGHIDHILARPVSRTGWLVGRLAVGAAVVVAASVVMGVASWVGAASQNSGVGLGDLLKAGINIAPPAFFVLGLGVLGVGVLPRRASAITYAFVTWSLLVELLASVVKTNHFVLDTSIISHIKPAPAANPNWASAGWLVVLGVALAGFGIVAFNRRDVVTE